MYNVINVKTDGSGKHIINLAFDKTRSTADTLKFTLKHRDPVGLQDGDTVYEYGFYSSFPIRDFMPRRDSTVVQVCWTWKGDSSSAAGKVKI